MSKNFFEATPTGDATGPQYAWSRQEVRFDIPDWLWADIVMVAMDKAQRHGPSHYGDIEGVA